jgi:hypothetical protein
VGRIRRAGAAIFAGDRRVWRAAAVCAVPLVLLLSAYCLVPRAYDTGTDNVEVYTYVAPAPTGVPVCVPDLLLPAGTARLRLQLISRTRVRPELHMVLRVGASTLTSELPPTVVAPDRISAAVFAIPELASRPAYAGASLCLTATELVNWGGTPLLGAPPQPPTMQGHPLAARIAIWYLPPAGARLSYLARAGAILHRASLFRPGVVGPWLYVLLLLCVLPALALASVRCLALASAAGGQTEALPRARTMGTLPPVAGGQTQAFPLARTMDTLPPAGSGRAWSTRRLAGWLFAIAALNFACWALITPPFQAPDEVDHFAYTQSLLERGEAPSRNPGSPLPRWSSAENLALEDMSFFTDHQVGDTKLPWAGQQERHYLAQVAALHPPADNGGGNETAATHGPIYYAALAPAYVLAGSSPFSQLTLMRLASALIGALTVLFTFLLARELAPGRPWLAVLAALLVAYEPMYGFISGAVNNDVGVNAGAAALELLLIRGLRRGVTLPWGLLTGGLLLALPLIKGTAYSLYPVAGVAFAAALWRHHRRRDIAGWAGVALGVAVVHELSVHFANVFEASQGSAQGVGSQVGVADEALAHPLGYLAYLWEVFLPRLSFMAPHFESVGWPAFVIFVERGWGAFGWYDVLFPQWVYVVILCAMLLVPLLGVLAARVEWQFVRRNLLEAAILLLVPIAVVAGFEAAFYTTGARPFLPEFGRYAFPAIGPLAVLVVASLHALGRRFALLAGSGLLVGMLALSFSAQLLTLTAFYA